MTAELCGPACLSEASSQGRPPTTCEARAPRRGGEDGAFLCLLSCRITRKSVARRGEFPAGRGEIAAPSKHIPPSRISDNDASTAHTLLCTIRNAVFGVPLPCEPPNAEHFRRGFRPCMSERSEFRAGRRKCSERGNPEGAVRRVRFFAYFLVASQESQSPAGANSRPVKA